MVKVKICGITDPRDALKACELGADFLGFVFFEQSPRRIDPREAHRIIEVLPENVLTVGLFLNQDAASVADIARFCGLDFLQLHGDEDPTYCHKLGKDFKIIKSFKVKDSVNMREVNRYKDAHFYLFDTYMKDIPGGTGVSFDWNVLSGMKFNKPVFLAGGLKPGNIRDAVEAISPYAVDVASGVEKSPGKKDYKLLKEFIDNAKKA